MYNLKANFYPAQEKKVGYIGKATITIGNAIRLNNISVFEKDDKRTLGFAMFGKEGDERSYVIPASKEAYASLLEVVNKAVDDKSDKHFGFTKGDDYKINLEVTGARVSEPYADGRFSVKIGDLCTLNGISTRIVDYEKDGEMRSFVAVDIPAVREQDGSVRMYKTSDGQEKVNRQFEGLKDKWTDKDGNEQSKDYAVLMNNLIRAKRKELGEPTLEERIAEGKAAIAGAGKDDFVPVPELDEEDIPY